MDPTRPGGSVIRRGAIALTAVLAAGLAGLVLAGCQPSGGAAASPAGSSGSASTSTSAAAPAPGATSASASASASPGFSVPGTHRSTATYQITTTVSTLVVSGQAGDVTVTGGAGSGTSVTQAAEYSSTPPVTSRAVSGKTLTISYSCPVQVVCGVAYVIHVARDVTVRTTDTAGAVRLAGLTGNVTAETRTGLISATGLSGPAVSLTTDVGGITAAFTRPPVTLRAIARVGAIRLTVPDGASYQVTADAHIGTATVSVPRSSSPAHVISASTDVGAIAIVPS